MPGTDLSVRWHSLVSLFCHLFLINRDPRLPNFPVNQGVRLDVGYIEKVNIFPQCSLNIIQESHKMEPTEAAVYQ